eukprot:CAMPEP_0194034782 /NCGR_PEP_ID=MMETSP0009_2-20130614/7207_1 /TAXON_ID=210454 /ORGANISM="Grammatophora oceanica, Strain CCMP 410" /LENGTH=340 /DNA_ID=CAMNT_0038675843 /DNA_START=420 /DNA_END=1442 /DNA_ORIENTATION=+
MRRKSKSQPQQQQQQQPNLDGQLNFQQGAAHNGQSDSCDAAIFLRSLQDPEIIERVRATIQNAHVFKLPPRQSASVGWRGADWKDKVWQGTVKVVERGELTAVLLVDRTKGSIFAVCPVKEGAVDRCVDSSRYFVLRIENANGRHMFIGVAFNERNDAFDFNTALEDSRREREMEKNPVKIDYGPKKDYSIKDGQKIKVSIPKQPRDPADYPQSSSSRSRGKSASGSGGGPGGKSFLKPSSRDTPRRGNEEPAPGGGAAPGGAGGPGAKNPDGTFGSFKEMGAAAAESFGSGFGGTNFFSSGADDKSTGSSNPFFAGGGGPGGPAGKKFDPRSYKTEGGR